MMHQTSAHFCPQITQIAQISAASKNLRNLRAKQLLSILALAALQTNASACAVCMGGDDTVMRNASNSTLWALLALVGFIFLATGATAFFLWRKATTFKTTSIA